MANVLVNEDSLSDIADAIRSKLGVSDTYKPSEMADAIGDISGGGITPTGTINITTNGTTDVTQYASANVSVPASAVDSGTKSISSNGTHDVVGYASASVSVANSYTSSDEGKVVSNGALVAQTSDTVTTNDTYDTTLINSLTVNVSGGGSGGLYKFASFNKESNIALSIEGNHVKIEALNSVSNVLINLRNLRCGTAQSITNMPKWFTIPSGTCVHKIENVVNANNRTFSMNFKQADTQTSVSGMGTGDIPTSGATVTVNQTASVDVGSLFVFIVSATTGNIIEFDYTFTVDGVRYI